VFYIDPTLDATIDEAVKQLGSVEDENSFIDKLLSESEETKIFHNANVDDEEEFVGQIEINLDDEIFSESTQFFNISEVLEIPEVEEGSLRPGDVSTEVKKIEEQKFSFNLVIADLQDDISTVEFVRDNSHFKYKCKSCDEWHIESLESAYRSLKIANALLSNLALLTSNHRELSTAIDFIDHDLRLIQHLLKCDYALDDDLEVE